MGSIKLLRKMGEAIDRRFLKKAGALPVPGSKLHVLLVCFHPYEGKKEIRFDEKTRIHPGQSVGELHLSNIRITQIAEEPSTRSMEWRLLEMLKAEFSALAEACVSGEIPEEIQAFYGVNVLTAGAKRLGFTLVPLPKGWNHWWLGFWESILRKVYYSYKTKKKVTLERTMDAYEVWITREQLIHKYAKASEAMKNCK